MDKSKGGKQGGVFIDKVHGGREPMQTVPTPSSTPAPAPSQKTPTPAPAQPSDQKTP